MTDLKSSDSRQGNHRAIFGFEWHCANGGAESVVLCLSCRHHISLTCLLLCTTTLNGSRSVFPQPPFESLLAMDGSDISVEPPPALNLPFTSP